MNEIPVIQICLWGKMVGNNSKTDDFTREDLLAVARNTGIRNSTEIIEQIMVVVSNWNQIAVDSGVRENHIRQIQATLLLHI